MDEPTVGLDPPGARMLRDIIRKLRSEGRTVLLTTHYLPEAEELCDRTVILNKGQIVVSGTPAAGQLLSRALPLTRSIEAMTLLFSGGGEAFGPLLLGELMLAAVYVLLALAVFRGVERACGRSGKLDLF